MRYIICYEGQQKVPEQFIAKDALIWDSGKIPVSWNFNWSHPPIGWATDIRREKDGSITAEIAWEEDAEPIMDPKTKDLHKNHSVSVYINKVESHSWKKYMWATAGQIKGLAVVPFGFWPHR